MPRGVYARKKKSKASTKVKPSKSDQWQTLSKLINHYLECGIADSWKGGGDPADMDMIELRFKIAHAELNAHMTRMQRDRQE